MCYVFLFSFGCEIFLSPPGDAVDTLPAHPGRCWQYFDWLPVGGGPRERFPTALRDTQLYLQYVAISSLEVHTYLICLIPLKRPSPCLTMFSQQKQHKCCLSWTCIGTMDRDKLGNVIVIINSNNKKIKSINLQNKNAFNQTEQFLCENINPHIVFIRC